MRVYTIRGYQEFAIQTPPAPRRMVSRYVPLTGTMVDSDTLDTVTVSPVESDTDLDADIAGIMGLNLKSEDTGNDTDTDSKATTTPVQAIARGRGRPSMTPYEKTLTAAHRAGQHDAAPVSDCPTCKRHS